MSYSYVRPFVGIPLNQLERDEVDAEGVALLEELQAFCDDDIDIQSLDDLSPLAELVRDWFFANRVQLKAVGVEFFSSYHGAYEFPKILGVYVDKHFDIPSYGAGKMRLDALGNVYNTLEEFREIYAKLDQRVRDIFDRNELVGMWFNSHSS